MSHLRVIRDWAVIVVSAVLFVVVLVVGWMMYVDGVYVNPAMVFDSKVLLVDKSEYAPGEVVSVHLDQAKLRDVPGRITWHLVNGRIFPYATRRLCYPTGVYEKWVALEHERLPTANLIDNGVYHYEATIEKDVNPLNTVTYKLKTVDFRIKNGG